MSTTHDPRSIAVVGVGRIGSALAYQLSRAGHHVTAIARPGSDRLAQLTRDDAIVLQTGDRAEVFVADQLDESVAFDLVVVTTTAQQIDPLLPALARSAARRVHLMFVTPEAARLRAAIGEQRTTFGLAAVLATLDDDGRLGLSIPRTASRQGDQRWVDLFRDAGMPARLEAEMGRWLRWQTPLTIAMESVSQAGMQHPRGATWSEARLGARGLRAGYSVLANTGESPYPAAARQISRAPLPLLTLLLWGVSRSRFRETVGQSAAECHGLIELLATEGATTSSAETITALTALQPHRTAPVAA